MRRSFSLCIVRIDSSVRTFSIPFSFLSYMAEKVSCSVPMWDKGRLGLGLAIRQQEGDPSVKAISAEIPLIHTQGNWGRREGEGGLPARKVRAECTSTEGVSSQKGKWGWRGEEDPSHIPFPSAYLRNRRERKREVLSFGSWPLMGEEEEERSSWGISKEEKFSWSEAANRE